MFQFVFINWYHSSWHDSPLVVLICNKCSQIVSGRSGKSYGMFQHSGHAAVFQRILLEERLRRRERRGFTNVESTSINQRCFDVVSSIQFVFSTFFQRLTNVGDRRGNVVSTLNRRHVARGLYSKSWLISVGKNDVDSTLKRYPGRPVTLVRRNKKVENVNWIDVTTLKER